MKKVVSLLLAVVLVISLCACASSGNGTQTQAQPETQTPTQSQTASTASSGEKVNYTIASTSRTAGTNWDLERNEMVAQLAELSGGRFIADSIDAGMQGDSREAVTSLQTGTFDILLCVDMEVDIVIGTLGWAWTPFLITNYDQADEIYYSGWINQELANCMDQAGIVKIGNAENCFRVCGTINTPIEKMSDFKGVKIRTPELSDVISFYEKCGATAVSIAASEVAMAMQQGMCDGLDNSIVNINNLGVLDACKYMTRTNHMYCGASIIANKDFWNSLSEEDQALFLQAAKAAGDKYIPLYREEEDALFKTDGLNVLAPDAQFMAQLVDIGQQIWDENKSKYPDSIVEKVDAQLAENVKAYQ